MDLFIKELYMEDSKLYNTVIQAHMGGRELFMNCVSVMWLEQLP